MRLALAALLLAALPHAQAACKVVDPELQGSYSGPCVGGLAEGEGSASGIAEYRGGFKAGLKHGQGVKTWPNGDRYEGGFVDDRKEGTGVYEWGRGPWAGERYEGGYAHDHRQGFGTYRWPNGDVYSGPWEDYGITGPATPMMLARAKFEEEARAAVAHVGVKVCRQMPVGLAQGDWIRGTVVQVAEANVGVRIDDPGRFRTSVSGVEVRQGIVVWDLPETWTPCY
jgi:hypothetical protein